VSTLPNFRIETLKTGSGTTIKLGGELDSATCGALVSAFEQIAAQDVARKVVLDFAELSFIDSAGMRAIIMVEQSAGERGVALTVVPAAGSVTDMLRMTGLADRVTLAPRATGAPAAGSFIERVELELPREPTAPARARAELREAFAGRLSDSDQTTLTLLISEVVTNAVIHPDPAVGGSVGLRMTAYADRVRVEVSDAGSGFDPGSLMPRPREAGGHGLIVVDGLASRWGTSHRTSDGTLGFCVWFELDVERQLSGALDEPGVKRRVAAAEAE